MYKNISTFIPYIPKYNTKRCFVGTFLGFAPLSLW